MAMLNDPAAANVAIVATGELAMIQDELSSVGGSDGGKGEEVGDGGGRTETSDGGCKGAGG